MTTSALLRRARRTRVLLDGLSAWMARKGSAAVEEVREILSVAPGTDETAHERAYHVNALRQANTSAHGGPWGDRVVHAPPLAAARARARGLSALQKVDPRGRREAARAAR
jgi:hypothetical protein